MTQLDPFRDPIWQFLQTIVGVIALIASIILVFVAYRLQRTKKSLAYQVITLEPLFAAKDIGDDKLVVTYGGVQVKSIVVAIIKIANTGNAPITNTDFVEPLQIEMGQGTDIVRAEIVEAIPPAIKPVLITSPWLLRRTESGQIVVNDHLPSLVKIAPTLLNAGDSITMKLIVKDKLDESVQVNGRVVGVNSIKCVSAFPTKRNRFSELLVTNVYSRVLFMFAYMLFGVIAFFVLIMPLLGIGFDIMSILPALKMMPAFLLFAFVMVWLAEKLHLL